MPKTGLTKLAWRLLVLVTLTSALAFLVGAEAPKASACTTCFNESRTAYIWCRDHYDPNDPNTWNYYGCNFNYACPAASANQVYQDECCWLYHDDPYWGLYCL